MSEGIDVLGSGDVAYSYRIGNLYAHATLTSSNGTTPVALLTGSPSYYITECGMQVDPVTVVASAGMVSLVFSDSVFGPFFTIRWYIPANVAGINVPSNLRITNGPGFFWQAKSINTTVSVFTDTALVAGSVRFFARYGLTNSLG